ncbi:MAG TPA: class I SAM-dependent methyltransferase [Chthonomonadaceae bacterium]|nr:class I SAM-dependent methyltransferase [Chthonomonadaceae bacterium]
MSAPTSYDIVQYSSHALPQTHPDRLGAIAALFGMCPKAVDECSVLELGCGDGGNLLPMAYGLPGSRFVGVDLAAGPIAAGQAMAQALGLSNIDLRCADIMEIGPEWGSFDYIIAHGFYSWAPPHVQDRLMSICGANLAPHGVGYVSYNTYPGAHMRQMMREMMLFHTRGVDDPRRKIEGALGLISLLSDAGAGGPASVPALQKELETIRAYPSAALLYHDDMSPANHPVYFRHFVEHAARHGLQFLGEADFFEMQDRIYPQAVRDALQEIAGSQILIREQYLDFIKCRRFRQTLLCHRGVALEREIAPERIMRLAVASQARPESAAPDLASSAPETFRGPNGAAMQTGHALSKAAMACLGDAWPRRIPFRELAALAAARLAEAADAPGASPGGFDGRSRGAAGFPKGARTAGGEFAEDSLGAPAAADDPDVRALAEILIGTYSAGLIELHAHVPDCAMEAGERPKASAVARMQLEAGGMHLTSLLHTTVRIEDPLGAALIRLLDGTRDRAALVRDLAALIAPDESSESAAAERIAANLEPSLAALARSSLLA